MVHMSVYQVFFFIKIFPTSQVGSNCFSLVRRPILPVGEVVGLVVVLVVLGVVGLAAAHWGGQVGLGASCWGGCRVVGWGGRWPD